LRRLTQPAKTRAWLGRLEAGAFARWGAALALLTAAGSCAPVQPVCLCTMNRSSRADAGANLTPTAERPAGLRAMKRQRVRNDLIQTSLKLFGKHGFDLTTVDDIVAAAGVSRRTF